MEKAGLIGIVGLIVAVLGAINGIYISSLNSRFQGLQDSISSFRTGLTDQIDALKSDLERIEEISAVAEQRMDINTQQVSDINQLLDSIKDHITEIEQTLNQSEPPPPPSPQPLSLIVFHPKTGDEVDWMTSVTGNSTGILTNKTLNLYFLVYPVESEGPWFVQNRPRINPDGSWSGLVYFGRNPDLYPEDVGDQYLLLTIVTTVSLQPGETFTESPENICQSLITDLVRK